MTDPDLDLLRRFARDQAQDAFAELVRRHVNLVYSAALRQVRSPQLAEEIAQSVFADLARVAATPSSPFGGSGGDASSPANLTAWLFTVTRRTAVDVIRNESRRQLREQLAYEMNITNAPDASWQHIEPLLDDAVAELDETDRAAVLLRYFENQSLRAVGQQLGVSDDAAQKRVSRAVERLREFFAKRGVSVGAGGLVVVISANAVQAAPVGLTVTISAVALAGTAATTSTLITATTKTIAMTTLQKTLVTATVAVLVGAGIYEARQAAQLRDQVQTLQQQQAPQAEQIQELQRERDGAINRLAGAREENERLKRNTSELLKLRGEIGQLRTKLSSYSLLTTPTYQPRGHSPGSYVPVEKLYHVGYETPETALETITWALWRGTYEQANEGLNPEMLANEMRNNHGQDQFEASRNITSAYKGVQIIAKKILSEDKVELKLKFDYDRKAMEEVVSFLPDELMVQPMIRIGNQWKLGGNTRSYEPKWEESGQVITFVQ